ncbi:MAG: efflux RND transporter periplasmic adaptor subunit [Beijerinckiaceae bacterium]
MAEQGTRRSKWPFLLLLVLVCLAGGGWYFRMPLPGLMREKPSEEKAKGAETAAALPGLIHAQGEVTVPDASPYRARVVVAPVRVESIRQVYTFPAVVEADPARTVNVLPPLGGRVSELKVQLGEAVKAGQVLIEIESGDLAQAQSDIEKAKATVELTKKALDRQRDLTKIAAGAVKDLEQATSDYTQAVSEQRRAEIRLATIAGKGEIAGERRLRVSAPISGTITSLAISPGSYINDPTQTLMTISNLEFVYVTANVPEIDVAVVHENEEVQFSLVAYPGREFRGRVTSISGLLDPDTRRDRVRISYENPETLLKPNMFATVSFLPPRVESLLVPASALLMNNDNTSVFVETKPWTFVRRTITPGADIESQVEVLGGLSAGERIVVRGGVLLND